VGAVVFIHVLCFLMCVLFDFSFIRLHVYVIALKSMVHCGSAFEPGASGLPCYCTPPVYVPAVIGGGKTLKEPKRATAEKITVAPRAYELGTAADPQAGQNGAA